MPKALEVIDGSGCCFKGQKAVSAVLQKPWPKLEFLFGFSVPDSDGNKVTKDNFRER